MDEVRDERPLSLFAERLAKYKLQAQTYKGREPKKFATLTAAAVAVVLGIAAWALVAGLSEKAEPGPGTQLVKTWLDEVWEHLLQPALGAPLISWSQHHLTAGAAMPAEAPMILWALVGAAVWLLGLGRSIYAKVVWPLFGAATTAMAHAGATPGRELVTASVVVLLWLALSLPIYRRRVPRLMPEPRPSRREELVQSVEFYKRALEAATPGTETYQTLRRYLEADLDSLVFNAKLDRARYWAEVFNANRGTAGAVLAGAGGMLLSLPFLGAGVTGVGVLVFLFSAGFLAFGLIEHSVGESEPVRVGDTPTDKKLVTVE